MTDDVLKVVEKLILERGHFNYNEFLDISAYACLTNSPSADGLNNYLDGRHGMRPIEYTKLES